MAMAATVSAADLRTEMRVRTRFLGLDFDPMTTAAITACLARKASTQQPFLYIVTPNTDHMVRLDRQPSLRPLYEDAGMVLNDSRILELLARLRGKTFPASPGADIVATLMQEVIRPDEPVVIIGSTASDIEALSTRFGLTDVRWHDAPMGLKDKPEAIMAAARFMVDNPARFHFICVGAPQQELVAWTALKLGGARGIGLCCGASIDFLSGRTVRAPHFMRKARIEWLHRLATEPKRLASRYLRDGPAIARIWWQHRKA